jgi:nucleotide-binding universal stress UspA family protein
VASRILVGVDGSDGSRRALSWAVSEAKMTGAIIDAIAVWESPYAFGEGLYTPLDEKKLADAALEHLTAAIGRVAGAHPDVEIHPVVLRGDPAQLLCTWSSEAQLLVLGTRGHGGFAGLLLGSVSAKCAQHSSCPVVIVPKNWPESGQGG